MKKSLLLAASLIAASLFLSECKTKKAAATAEPAKPAAEMAEINAGHELFDNKCGTCHKLPSPRKHDDTGWGETMDRMAPKAQLNATEKVQVLKYLTSANK
ncbi:MAG: cytochrome C [Bacteroidetes bacterium]|nr:cytochrome C [Bacteroidota bacterium]